MLLKRCKICDIIVENVNSEYPLEIRW